MTLNKRFSIDFGFAGHRYNSLRCSDQPHANQAHHAMQARSPAVAVADNHTYACASIPRFLYAIAQLRPIAFVIRIFVIFINVSQLLSVPKKLN